jgi:ubiquinol-cytochrome c reductase cytochrome b subunit
MADLEQRGRLAALADAIDERIGHRAALARLLDEPLRGGARWGYVLGAVLLALFVVELVTGVALMTVYAPSSQSAWASVAYLQDRLPLGWLVRGVHHVASHALVIVCALHLGRVIWAGAYRRPREASWLIGLALFGVVIGFAITGGRLPWDQNSYWATKVEINIAATVPIVGEFAQRFAQGGTQAGHLTLTRLYALHVGLLPIVAIALVALHRAVRLRHGATAPSGADLGVVEPRSKQLARDGIASLIAVAIVFAFAIAMRGAPLGAPADPSTDYPARPEWFLMPLYELRKFFSGKGELIATVVIPGIVTTFVVLLPWIDRKSEGSPRARLGVLGALGAIGLGGAVLFGLARRNDARDPKLAKALALADERATHARGLAGKGVPPEGPLEMLARDPQTRGAEIWEKECATCHTIEGPNADRKGADAPDLAGWGTVSWAEAVIRDPDADHLFGKTFLKGEMPSMTKPPPGKEADFKPMPDADVKAVAAFVTGAADARGKEVFGDACGGCHKRDGDGGGDSDLAPDLTGWGSYAWLRQQIADPSKTYGEEAMTKKGHMPGFEKDLGAEVDVIARWTFWKAQGRWPDPKEVAAASAPASVPPSTPPKGEDAEPPPVAASASAAAAKPPAKPASPPRPPAKKKGK